MDYSDGRIDARAMTAAAGGSAHGPCRGGAVGFASAKFAVRGLAESLGRELWPKGIHVAHVIVDGAIDTPADRAERKPRPDEPRLDLEAMAESYWTLVQQPRRAWTLEIDLRPHNEEFFT